MGGMCFLWIILLVGAIVIEAMTMGLTCIWFAGGALAGLLLERIGAGIYLQVSVCLIVSLVLMYFTRPIAVKYFNKERVKTNLDDLVGRKAVVTEEISNLYGTGQVTVAGKEWSARSTADEITFETGAIVKVTEIRGVKLMVCPDDLPDASEE